MKKILKKFFTAITVTICSAVLFPGMTFAAENTGLDMVQLQRKFPNGAYWNHVVGEGHDSTSMNAAKDKCNNPDGYTWNPCTAHFYFQFTKQEIGWTDCNRFGGSIQCYGFASKLAQDVYGEDFNKWKITNMETEDIKPGDIIWYFCYKDSVYGHKAMVIDVDGSRLCLGECNWCDACMISWGRWMNTKLVYKWSIYHAPYELPRSGVENLISEKKGDVDNDNSRSLNDSIIILQSALGIQSLDEAEYWCCDMDGDGTVSLGDALLSLKNALGIEFINDYAVEWQNATLELDEKWYEFDEIFYKDIPKEEREDYFEEHWKEYYEQAQEFFSDY